MSACLHVIGLGPAGLEQLTLGSYRLIGRVKKVFVRTSKHPCVQELIDEGIDVESFDEVYAAESSFEAVYEKIVEQLREELQKGHDVIYAVPGHPMVAEKTIKLINEQIRGEYNVVIHPAVSFADEIFKPCLFQFGNCIKCTGISIVKRFFDIAVEYFQTVAEIIKIHTAFFFY